MLFYPVLSKHNKVISNISNNLEKLKKNIKKIVTPKSLKEK